MRRDGWRSVAQDPPPKGRPVETMIVEGSELGKIQVLTRGGENGRLWFIPDTATYVYYEPTHWREAGGAGDE